MGQNMRKYLIIFILLLSGASNAFSDITLIDSLQKQFWSLNNKNKIDIGISLAIEYSKTDYEKCEQTYRSVLTFCKVFGDRNREPVALAGIGACILHKKYSKAGIDTILLAAKRFKENNNYGGEFYAYSKIAAFSSYANDFASAVEYFEKALIALSKLDFNSEISNYKKSPNDSLRFRMFGLMKALSDLGNFQNFSGNLKISLKYYSQALEFSKVLRDNYNGTGITINIGAAYEKLEKYNEALDYYRKGANFALKYNYPKFLSSAYVNIASIYNIQNKAKQAESFLLKAKSINDEYDIRDSNIDIYFQLGKTYHLLGNNSKAKEYISEALRLSDQSKNYLLKSEIFYTVALIYEKDNNYRLATVFFKKYIELEDSLDNIQSDALSKSLQAKYDFKNKNAEIELLKKNDELNKAEIKKSHNDIIFSSLVGLILFIAIIIITRYYKHNLKTKNEIEDKNEELENANRALFLYADELKELNATKDKFFSIMTHDIKNPIYSVKYILDTLQNQKHALDEEDRDELTLNAFSSTNQLIALIENLLTWSRSQTGKIKFTPEKCDLNLLADNAAMLLALQSENKNIKIINKIPEEYYVHADLNMISTILRNLLSNSIKYSPNGKDIEIDYKETESEQIIIVKDHGVGMSKENSEKLFKLNSHYSSPGTANEKGTGLGLIICREFADAHKGDIWVESEEGVGSSFYISIPKRAEGEEYCEEVD
jgi:signal transduction histidine kinase